MKKIFVLAAGMASATFACAAASPLDPAVEVPGLQYQSAFADYRPFDDKARAEWREVNRIVDEASRTSAGGHAGHGAAPAAPAAAAPAASMPAHGNHGSGHSGRGPMHGGAR